MHKANTLVAQCEQVRDSQFSPLHIIDRNRAQILNTAWTVEQDNGNAMLTKPL